MEWLFDRLSEKSTWYGLGVVVAGIAAHFFPNEWASVMAGVQFVLGGAAFITPERKA